MTGESTGPAILVAEDDPSLRRMVCRFLGDAGYTVVEASSGEEALPLAVDRRNRIGLVLTDIRMPGMSGCELAQAVRRDQPTVPVVYMSGYVDVDLEPNAPLLKKPFHLVALEEAVRTALAAPVPRPVGSVSTGSVLDRAGTGGRWTS